LVGVFHQAASSIQESWHPSGDQSEDIPGLVDRALQQAEDYYNFWRMIHALRFQLPEDHEIAQELQTLLSMMRNRLYEAFQEEGAQEPEIQSWELMSLLDGMIGQYLLQPKSFPIEALQDRLKRLYSHGYSTTY
jgi:hypothetical protein